MMKIFIPTYYREAEQKCFKHMGACMRENTYLCTRYDRVEALQHFNPRAKIIDLGMTDGIADVRQKLINMALQMGIDKIFIIDDKVTFNERAYGNLRRADVGAIASMYFEVMRLLDKYVWVGISDRAGNNRVKDSLVEVARSYSCYAINVKKFNKLGITFDGMYQKDNNIKQYEDFYALLSLLSKGEPNAVLYDWAFNHTHGQQGGNSMHRTTNSHAKSLYALQKEFPDYVKIRIKKDVSWSATKGDNHRYEPIIQWKKIYRDNIQ